MQKKDYAPTHCSGGPSVSSIVTADHNNISNFSSTFPNSAISSHSLAATVTADFLPSSNSGGATPLEELGAFSITTHSGATNIFCQSTLLHNQDRGGSRYLGQADHVETDVSSDVGSHVNRDWLTRRFHPPDQTDG